MNILQADDSLSTMVPLLIFIQLWGTKRKWNWSKMWTIYLSAPWWGERLDPTVSSKSHCNQQHLLIFEFVWKIWLIYTWRWTWLDQTPSREISLLNPVISLAGNKSGESMQFRMAGLQYIGSSFDPTRSVKLIGTYSKKRFIERSCSEPWSIYEIGFSLFKAIGVAMVVRWFHFR